MQNDAPLELPSPRHSLDVPALVARTHALLAAGVPLTLLIDLGDEDGPHSQARFRAEGGDAGWLAP